METINNGNYVCSIIIDTFYERDRNDSMGKFAVSNRNNFIKNEFEDYYIDDFDHLVEFEKQLNDEEYLYIPLFMYVHSDIAISSTPFGCQWDSGKIGYYICSKETVISEYSDFSDESKAKALVYMQAEIEENNDVIQGNVYGFEIYNRNNPDEILESCYGYIGESGLSAIREEFISFCQEQYKKDNPLFDFASI